eukprot:3941797-Rhodomonas_salina.1
MNACRCVRAPPAAPAISGTGSQGLREERTPGCASAQGAGVNTAELAPPLLLFVSPGLNG